MLINGWEYKSSDLRIGSLGCLIRFERGFSSTNDDS